ncbi:MAG: erythromycin esterase family protein [Chitinophagaceae bacterium]
MKRVCCLLLFLCLYNISGAQQKVTINGKDDYIYPVSITDDSLSSLQPLKELFASKQIVALGEATHGTREFMQLKIAFLKFLITSCGYRSVIAEVPFGAMLFLDDYVTEGTGDVDAALRNVGFWGLYTAEFRDFINWTKNYNKGRPIGDKVHLWGMDMQTLLDPLFYLQMKAGMLPADAKAGFETVVQPLLEDKKQSGNISTTMLSDSLKSKSEIVAARLQQWTRDNQQIIEATYSRQGAGVWQLCVQNFVYSIHLYGNYAFYRDSCMAANVTALTGLIQQRSAVWAHNEHVGRHDSIVNYANLRKMMGEFLHHTFKDKYYPVGFLFERGSFLAMEEKVEKTKIVFPNLRVFSLSANANNKLAADLSGLSNSPFFIDLTNSSNSTWRQFHPFYIGGAIQRRKQSERLYRTPALVFSALVFVPETTAIVQIDNYFRPTVK